MNGMERIIYFNMKGTKRGMQRKHLIQRVQNLEYVVSQLMNNSHNFEILFDSYVEMNDDIKKFEKFLDKKAEDARSPKPEPK